MGKVKEAVRRHIRNGDVIACDVEADFAVIAGEHSDGRPVRPATQGEGSGLESDQTRSSSLRVVQRTPGERGEVVLSL